MTKKSEKKIKQLLQASSLAPSTYSAYSSAVARFNIYCHSQTEHPHHNLPNRSAILELDECLGNYIAHVFSLYKGKNKQLAANTIFGIYALLPHSRGLLKGSEQLLKGWNRLTPSVSHPPLTWPVTVLIAVTLAKNRMIDAAIATLVAFDALLRVGELTNITIHDVSFPGDFRRGNTVTSTKRVRFSSSLSSALSSSSSSSSPSSSVSSSRVCIRLANTKTGRNQWTELYNEEVGLLLQQLIESRHHSTKLVNDRVFHFPSTRPANYYRRCLDITCRNLKLDHCHFTPHSLRHGGATHAHMHLNQSVEQVMLRGRWKSNDACRTYIQSGSAILLTQSLPSTLVTLTTELMSDWYSIIRSLCFHA